MPWDQPGSIHRSSIRRGRNIGSQHFQINSTVDYDTPLRFRSHTIRLVPQAMTKFIWIHSMIVRLLAGTNNRRLALRAPLDTSLSVAQ